jgi:hypothetical protein
MGVLPVTKEQLGKKTLAQLPINPLFISDFNRVRLEFVGHYRDVCENPASSTLWLDVGRSSSLDLTYQSLAVANDLSRFPVPFFDPRDNRPVTLPMVFAGAPEIDEQKAASIVASWFGSRSGWRGQSFPVMYDKLPDTNAIVFATNASRPAFLRSPRPKSGWQAGCWPTRRGSRLKRRRASPWRPVPAGSPWDAIYASSGIAIWTTPKKACVNGPPLPISPGV